MIKGYYINEEPCMTNYTPVQVLSELDALNTRREEETAPTPDEDKVMVKKSFFSKNFYIDSYTTDSNLAHAALIKIYKNIELANPELIKVIDYSDDVFFIAYNKFSTEKDNVYYSLFLEELSRLSTFFEKEFDEVECVRLIEVYIMLCLSTPKTRKNKNNKNDED